MYIKQFRTVQARVRDPLRPGKHTYEDRQYPTGAHAISHAGQSFTADEDGWFEVPAEVGATLLAVRHPGGEQFFTPEQVDEQVRLGAAEDASLPSAAKSSKVTRVS